MKIEDLANVALIIFIPLSIAANLLNWGSLAVFGCSALSIIPLSVWLSTATEKVAIVTGPAVGGLVNAIFGSATGLIVALVALKEGLVNIVKASITGSILCDLLVFMGLAMFAGGLRYKEQEFKPIFARVNGSSMLLAVTAIALPTTVIYTSNVVDPIAIRNLSLIDATVLIIVYGLTLLFSLKTHSYLYDVSLVIETELGSSPTETDKPDLMLWTSVLVASTVALALESELFVGSIDSGIEGLGLTPLFIGVIIVPLVSDVAGIVISVRLAIKNNMDLAMATATGNSLLVSLFVAPILVLVGQFIGQSMDLNFNLFEVVALAIAVTVTNLISSSGRSHWLDGTLLLATYIVLGVAFYYHPA